MLTTNKGERHALARIKPGNGSDVASHSAVVPTTGSGSCARWWDLGDAPGPAIHVGQVRAAQTEEGMERNQEDEQ